ncbi:nuclear hormone receptor HR96 [Musca autumnalis]|uniref:nuclear hormone receptor HR96 n=1 Tax=Musca autumnalis TaxID=221902 RepID=UPI003CE9853E
MTPANKVCAVCGDKALGYNFGAVTCESCKAFFRRNALAKKQFTCPFSQNCEINVVTRRFCQKCRLKKCLDIGMKSENIMSEEDKMIKRRKIETNRAKRKITERSQTTDEEGGGGGSPSDVVAADSSGYDAANFDSQSCGSFDSSTESVKVSPNATSSSNVAIVDNMANINPKLMTGEEMVDFIVCDPDRASQAISKLMRTPAEAMTTLEKIISSQKDALRLISHLINYPGDALKIISKFMNSPFNALTVFTKFMSSPTDALEIISKVVSSPQDVLQFIKNLMDSPEDAVDIMNKFMNTPAEALRMLNRILNSVGDESQQQQQQSTSNGDLAVSANPTIQPPLEESKSQKEISMTNVVTTVTAATSSPSTSQTTTTDNTLIHSMLNYPSPNDLNTNILSTMTSPAPSTPYSLVDSNNYATPPSSVSEPICMVASPLEYQNSSPAISNSGPSSIMSSHPDDQPTTSNVGLLSPTEVDAAAAAEFASEHFDIKTFIQNSFPENATGQYAPGDSLNSLESVLTEVIRIEFQAFNNLPPEPRVKQEHYNNNILDFNSSTTYASGCAKNVTCMPQQQPLQCQQQVCSPSSVSISRDLNETEMMKLRELKLASEALYLPVDDDLSVLMSDDRIKPGDNYQDPKLLQVINLTAVAIKRLIKMAKKITAFRDMCQEDQVALLKGGCTEMMIMRSVMTYDDNRNTWKIPHTKENMSNIRAEVLKLAKGNVYEELQQFLSTFDEKWRIDENIILIMCAIVLFSPSRSRIVHSDVIRLEQNSYYYLLRRYLESVYPGCEAKSAFIKLIQKISDVERLNQFIIGVYLNVNPSQVEPLLREIFDLKNH